MTRYSSILFLLLVLFLSSTSFAEENVFYKPSLRLDWCLHWGRDCGKPAADAFCQMNGYTEAESWKLEGGLTTFVLGDGKICKGSCDGFSSINCRKGGVGPGPATTVPQYLGCFKDQGDPGGTSGRDLSGAVWQDGKMTIESCQAYCGQRNFAYAGVQYSTWCFCGNSYGKYGQANNCDMKCGGNPNEICGGSWANSIYSTTGGTSGPHLFKSRWDKIAGPGGPWTTDWVPNVTDQVCGHSAPGCSCPGHNYCGIYKNGDVTYWWPQGCAGPMWTIRCTSVPQ